MREQGRGKRGGTTKGAAWLMAIALMSISSAFAANVETLLMPGKVSRAHEKQEVDCTNCHDRSNVKTQTSLCLDCHKDIAADVRQHQRYHGRMTNAGVGECRACHTEHKAERLTSFNSAARNSIITSPTLRSRMRTLRSNCESCHKKGEAWRKAPANCVGCHKKDDIHRGQFTQSCGECHSS